MTDAADIPVHRDHAPAVKVGGRRLSVTTKHKAPATSEPTAETTAATQEPEAAPSTDYPRPAAPGDEHPHEHPHHNEEELPKKEKKSSHENEKKFMEIEQRKLESTRPTRDLQSGGKGFGGGGRISQPAGKQFGV